MRTVRAYTCLPPGLAHRVRGGAEVESPDSDRQVFVVDPCVVEVDGPVAVFAEERRLYRGVLARRPGVLRIPVPVASVPARGSGKSPASKHGDSRFSRRSLRRARRRSRPGARRPVHRRPALLPRAHERPEVEDATLGARRDGVVDCGLQFGHSTVADALSGEQASGRYGG